MSEDRKDTKHGVTIVGGRPMHRALQVTDLPIGLEQALTVAAINPSFRDDFEKDPVGAATKRGIAIDEVEAKLLGSVGPDALRKMAERMVVPSEMSRRSFTKRVAASVVAMVSGSAFLLCSGCTGADTWDSDADIAEGAVDQWANLYGYTCYTYMPAAVAADRDNSYPLLLCLHDEGEDCLANIQRWRSAADYFGFHLISVNWEPATADLDTLADDLPQIRFRYLAEQSCTASQLFLCGRGAGSAAAWTGLNETDYFWDGAVLLGGLPQGEVNPIAVGTHTRVYYVIGTDDSEYADAVAFSDSIDEQVTLNFVVLTGTTSEAVLSFEEIWRWLT